MLIDKINSKTLSKVLLINPQSTVYPEQWSRYPVGLLCLAAHIQSLHPDLEICILDLQLQPINFDLQTYILSFRPDIALVTAITPYIRAAQEIANIFLRVYPECICMIGGYHFTVLPLKTFKESDFDCGVIGAGEQAINELLCQWKTRKLNLNKIPGLVFTDAATNQVVINPQISNNRSLDNYSFPTHGLKYLLNSKFKYQVFGGTTKYNTEPASLLTQRGCDSNCAFCGTKYMFPEGVSYRSPSNVVDEIQFIIELGNKNIYILDDSFNSNVSHAKNICLEILDRRISVEWVAMGRTDVLDPELYYLMSKAGCVEIALGVESFDINVRVAMGKGSSVNDIYLSTQMIRRAGISVKYFLIVGSSPPETLDSTTITSYHLERLKPDKIRVFKAIPYPGSRYWIDRSVRVLPEYEERYEHWWATTAPRHALNSVVGITTTDLMNPEEIDIARQRLIETHKAYGGKD